MEEAADKVADVPLHRDARTLIRDRSTQFGAALTSQAKLLAEYNGHDVVLTKHVQEAYEVLRGPRPRPWANEVASTIGGIVLGTGATSFVSEVARAGGMRPWHTVGFVALLVAGLVVVLVAALTKR